MSWLWEIVRRLLLFEAPPPPAANAAPAAATRAHVWEHFEPNPSRRPLAVPYCLHCKTQRTATNLDELCPELTRKS